MPEGEQCQLCGIDLSRSPQQHAVISSHPLMPDILATAETGKLTGKVAVLLSASYIVSTRALMVQADFVVADGKLNSDADSSESESENIGI